jgi:hypothetical protein
MKRIILILSIVLINYNCKAQINAISTSELTVNNVEFLGSNVSSVTQHLGQPHSNENYYLEMDDVMSQKYIYSGIIFYIVNSMVDSFEITGNTFNLTKNNIKVGDNISTLQTVYPLSFANRSNNSLTIRFNNIDRYLIIFFNVNNQITKMRLGNY